jgi:general secretion pathway protein C
MRLRTYPRTERLFRGLPRPTTLSVVEWLLLALIAVQAARLVWVLVTPVGPVGDWRPAGASAVASNSAVTTNFDPFFRLSAGGGPSVVTSLNLKLHGVREDRATGRGSAIIALPDGSQRSFGVGEEIIPGVRLAQVGFDSVTIDRGGVPEQIFLDQSEPTQPAQPGAVGAPRTVAPAPPIVQPQTVPSMIVAPPVPRPPVIVPVSPPIPGLAPGDVVVSVNGRPAGSPEQALAAIRGARGPVNIIVNRGGRAVPIQVRPNP